MARSNEYRKVNLVVLIVMLLMMISLMTTALVLIAIATSWIFSVVILAIAAFMATVMGPYDD